MVHVSDCVGTCMSCAKTYDLIDMPFLWQTHLCLKNPCITWQTDIRSFILWIRHTSTHTHTHNERDRWYITKQTINLQLSQTNKTMHWNSKVFVVERYICNYQILWYTEGRGTSDKDIFRPIMTMSAFAATTGAKTCKVNPDCCTCDDC